MNSARRRAEWQIALWGIFAACFVAAGALPLGYIRHHRVAEGNGPYNSIDSVLRSELGLENGAATITAAVANVPADTPISVVYCSTAVQSLAGLITTQVLWPRNVEEFRCTSPVGADLDRNSLSRRGGIAVFVSLMPPDDFGEPTMVGSHIRIVRLRSQP